MDVEKIQAALRKQTRGLATGQLCANSKGERFFGCALGVLFHAAGKRRRDIETEEMANYGFMFDGLLKEEYGLDTHEIDAVVSANDSFLAYCPANSGPKRLRDFMILWFAKFAQFRNKQAPAKANKLARKAVGCDF